ncbi:MAG: KDGP aldolase, partial [Culicoidibacterales bacterium]
KFFPMNGLATIEEYKIIAKSCSENNFALEPTGGINLDNFEKIVQIAMDAGVKKIIPHVYSSIIDDKTGATNINDVKKLMAIIERIV